MLPIPCADDEMQFADSAIQANPAVSVLLVEDEAIIAADLRLGLLNAGYTVFGPVATGLEAIEVALTQKPDIILMDVKIRGSMDGITAAEQILDKMDVPLVLATSYSDQATIDRANKLKPQAIVFKPYDGQEICAELQLALQRHRMQRKLRDSESRYRHLFENNIAGVFRTSLEADVLDCNDAMAKILGFERADEVLHRKVTDFYADITVREPLLAELRSTKRVREREMQLKRKDGSPIWTILSLAFHADGTVIGTAFDISHRKALEQQLHEQLLFQQSLLDTIPVPIFYRDRMGIYRVCNAAFESYFGKSREQVLGSRLADTVPEPFARIFAASDVRLIASGGVESYEAQTVDRNGTRRPVESHKAALRGPDGQVQGVVGVLFDLEERNRAAGALRESEAKFRLISENVGDLIALFTADATVLYSSPAVRRFGYDPESLAGKPFRTLLHPEDALRVEEGIRDVVDGSNRQILQCRIHDKAREWRTIELSLDLFVDDDGVTVLGVAHDITDRMRHDAERASLERQLRQRNAELEETVKMLHQTQDTLVQSEKLASIGQLTAGIAHEINNPLAFVSSNINRFEEYFDDALALLLAWKEAADAMPKDVHAAACLTTAREVEGRIDLPFITDDFRRLLDHTRNGIGRIKTIVEQLRGFTHLSQNGFAETDLNGALEETVMITWNELKYKAVIVRDYEKIPPVSCNIGEIKQVLVNLVVNAAHAVEEGGTITLRTRSEARHVLLEVEDSGHGIPPENLKRIFDPFFTTKGVGKGTGLGLWISTTIMRKHNGTLTVQSEPGKGSVFTVRLPLQQPEAPGEEDNA